MSCESYFEYTVNFMTMLAVNVLTFLLAAVIFYVSVRIFMAGLRIVRPSPKEKPHE